MAKFYNTTKSVSLLICFEGKNRRVMVDEKKCVIDKKNKSFTYKALYKADNGKEYLINAESLPDSEGLKAKVIIKNRSGKQIIAERHCVDVRFGRYLYDD
jgi:hypothetical protein